MKKISFLFAALLCMLLPALAYAAAEAGMFDADARLMVTGTAPDKTADISVSVLDNSYTIEAADSVTDGAVVYTNQIKPKKDGEFSLRVNLKNRPTGEYRIRVYQNGKELLDTVRPYAAADDNMQAIEGLNKAAASGVSDVEEYIKQNRVRLQFVSPFDDTADMTVIARLVTAAAPFDTGNKLYCAGVYQRAAVAAAVADGKIDKLTDYSSMIKPMNESPMQKVLSADYVTDTAKSELAKILRGLAPFNTLDDFDLAVADALILSVTKNPTGAGDVKTVISALRPGYNTSRLTSEVCRKVAYNSYASFEKLNEAIINAQDSGNNSGSGGSSGGGGGKAPVTVAGGGEPVQRTDSTNYGDTNSGTEDITDGFKDMDNFEWAENAVNKLLSESIISGDGSGNFMPENNITREEFVKMLVLIFDISPINQEDMTFNDINSDEWYYPYLQIAFRSGVVNGISEDTFGIGMSVTRQDAAALISRAMKLSDENTSESEQFTDEAEISDYALNAVQLLRKMGIVNGYEDGSFRPLGTITRAEAAKMLYEGWLNETEYISVSSPSDSDDKAENADDFAFRLLKSIGIFDEGIAYRGKVNQTVSRGEFALYLARMLKADNITGKTANEFADVSDKNDLSSALAGLKSTGIVQPDENGKFRPNDTITISEISEMLVRSFGSEYINMLVQNSDNNYLSIAAQLDILKGISNFNEATFGDCVVMMYNTLHTEYPLNYSEKKTNLLKYIYDIEYIKGRVTSNCFTEISGTRTNDIKKVNIDGIEYISNDEIIHELLGYHLIVYYTEENDERNIVCYDINKKTSVVRIDAEDIDKYSDLTLYYYNGQKNMRIKLEPDTAIIYNGIVLETDYEGAFNIDTGFITVISSGNVDTVIIESYDTLRVTGIDVSGKKVYAERVEDGSVTELDFKEGSGKWVFFKSYPYGKAINETMLISGDILCVSKSADGSYMRGWQCTQTVSGNIETVSGSADDRQITINGEQYRVAHYYKDNIVAGEQSTFVLDIAGRIASAGKQTQTDRTLGYLYKLTDSRNDPADENIYVKIYNVRRQHELLTLADTIILDGKRKSVDYVKQILCSGQDGKLVRQPVFYRTNKDGEIKEIDLAAPSEQQRERDNTLEELLSAGSYSWMFPMKTFERKYVLSAKTYYMRVPPENIESPDEKLFGVQEFSSVTWWNNNNNKSILGLYRYDDSTPFADLVLMSSSDNASLSNSTEITMVTDVYEQWIGDDDGELVLTLHGYRKGSEVTAYFDEDVYKNDIEEGDLIRFATNSAGRIGVYEKIYDQSEDTALWNMTGTADEYTSNTTPSAGLRYTFGYVNSLYNAPYTDGLNSVISTGRTPETAEDTWQFNSNASSSTRYIIYDPERRNGNRVYMAGLDEVVSWENCRSAEKTAKAFVHTRQGYLSALFIYK